MNLRSLHTDVRGSGSDEALTHAAASALSSNFRRESPSEAGKRDSVNTWRQAACISISTQPGKGI
jgi:hypothetical protein